MKDPIRDTAIGVLAIVLAAAAVAFANLPSRVAVLELGQRDLSSRLESIDKKLDVLLGRN